MRNSSVLPKILIVDDDERNLLALEVILRQLRAEVIKTTSGQRAVEIASDNKIALVILDVQMPEMDGFDTAKAIRAQVHEDPPPILFATAHDPSQDAIERAYDAGGADFITKPIQDSILLAKAKVFLDLFQTKAKLEEQARANAQGDHISENFLSLFRQTPEMVVILGGPEHTFEFVNEAHVRVLGFDATGMNVREAQPESVELHSILDDVYRTGVTAELREIAATVGRGRRYFDLTYAPRRNAKGDVDGIMIMGSEITDQVLNREGLKLQGRAFELAVSEAPLDEILETLATMAEVQIGGQLAAAVLLGENGWIHNVAAPSLPKAFEEKVRGMDLSRFVKVGTQVHFCDLEKDAQWSDLRTPMLSSGFKSCWSQPILSTEGKLLGCIAFYSSAHRNPNERERQVAGVASRVTSIIIERGYAVIDRAKSAAALAARDEQFKFALQNARMGSWTVDLKTGLVILSKEAQTFFGGPTRYASAQEAIGNFIHPEDQAHATSVFEAAVAKGGDYHDEYRVLRPDGSIRWGDLRGIMTLDENGAPLSASGLVMDITERKKAEEELVRSKAAAERAREEMYQFFMQSPTPIVILTGREMRFTLANSLYEKYVNRPVLGKTLREAFADDELRDYEELLLHVFDTGEPFVGRALPFDLREPSGQVRHARVDVSYTAYRDQKGDIAGVLVFLQDVTEEYHARERIEAYNRDLLVAKDEAERANQLKSAFLANMSHEIRTPLGAMIGFADLLRDPGLTPTQRANYIDILSRNGQNLSVIINDILDLSKVEAGHLTLEFTDTSPEQIAEDVISLLRVKAKEKDIALEYIFEKTSPKSIVSDPTRVRQILLNLVGNAIKFTPFGSVTVRSFGCVSHDQRPSVCFEVTDTGIGIPDDQRERVFEMFVQADGSTTRRFGGTGLGLALSKSLAKSLGGDIVITKTAIGKGTTFLVTIVDQPEKRVYESRSREETKAIRESQTAGAKQLEGVRVLVVDDAPDNQQLIWHYLTKQGAIVDAAENGMLGVKMALAGLYDIVLMDIQMPEMDGYTATNKLRMAGFNKPIIALTAHAMAEIRDKIVNAGATAHLPKPINFRDLVAMIAENV